ncbi:DNA-binding transcriptional regulator, GntR family [Desulfuromusa kysingii]|uniref:DNA-binding transcriptional regulator, GntR family n=1 Tax=Desulfuromusa kysingii TaxID=37625 RepID=A0A1H3YB92_9BACT|nr:GntR family transcriptional regulator [Desulfuromusa kysingii]SEA08793.1 DNA-binding transcriptional regulator, GntR family [Desulfuromusa kysingii]
MNQLKRSRTLTELAANRIRKAIIDNEYKLGEPLSESLLANSMGTSKTPIREALALLKIEGLVNIFPQKGTFVFTLSLLEVKQLIEIRFILESAAIKLAFSNNREKLLEALSENLMNMENSLRVNDINEYLTHDSRFHECFFTLCENHYLSDAYSHIIAISSALRTRVSHQPNHTNKTFEEHQILYNFITKGELEKALEVLHYHFSSFEKLYATYCDQITTSHFSSTRKNRQSHKDERGD